MQMQTSGVSRRGNAKSHPLVITREGDASRGTTVCLRRRPSASYVDGPYWQALFDVSNELVCFGHMSGLLVRVYDRWP